MSIAYHIATAERATGIAPAAHDDDSQFPQMAGERNTVFGPWSSTEPMRPQWQIREQEPINANLLAIPIPLGSNNKSLIYLILVVFPSHLIRAQMIIWRVVPGSSTEMALMEMRIGIPV